MANLADKMRCMTFGMRIGAGEAGIADGLFGRRGCIERVFTRASYRQPQGRREGVFLEETCGPSRQTVHWRMSWQDFRTQRICRY